MENSEKIKILEEEINKYEVAITEFKKDLEKAELLDDKYNIKHIPESIIYAEKQIEKHKNKLTEIRKSMQTKVNIEKMMNDLFNNPEVDEVMKDLKNE